MIAGDDDVELAARGAQEDGVGGKRSGHVDAARAARRDGRRDHAVVFVPEQPVLAGVRIEPGHGDARAAPTKRGSSRAVSSIVPSSDSPGQRPRHLAERDVHRRQHDAQRVGVEHHRHVLRAGQVREQIGVAGPRQAGEPERLLVDRRGGDGVDDSRPGRPRSRGRSTSYAARPASALSTPGANADASGGA